MSGTDKIGVDESVPGENPRNTMLYPPSILDAFQSGAMMDLRVRFAMQLLTSSPLYQAPHGEAFKHVAEVADSALSLAEEFFIEAERRGWLKQTPTDPNDPAMAALIEQAKRQGIAGAHQQMSGQKAMREGVGAVQPAVPMLHPRGH